VVAAADAVRVAVVVVADAAGSRKVNLPEKGLRESAAPSSYALAPFITFVICSRPAPT
jgi:hypothetical protein